ncbi:MAG: UvrD-helicase domain-containing protein [Candidatus Uhrbacteria bacterium]
MPDNLLENLNDEQLQAAMHKDGPLMIIAGAGTGKTTVITQRVAWLIEQKHAAPDEVLALTFTEKAATEMEERVDRLLPMGYVDLWISTFHAFCERVLRDHGVEIGLSRNFKLLSEIDTWLLMRQNFDRFELDYYRPLGNQTKYLKSLLQHFSRAKDEVITPEEYLKFAEGEKANLDTKTSDDEATTEVARLEELANAYHTYQQILLENDAMDFGDLIMYTLQLLRRRPKILKELRQKFKYVLVDEFQDTNWAQYELIKLLAAPKNNLTVVGDDDQSIYKFRGASLSNILQFEVDFPDATQIVLTKNYRTVQSILDHAYNFIQKNNPNRLETQPREKPLSKRLVSHRQDAGLVEHIHCKTLDQEVEKVADRILELKKNHPDADWSDFGILVRANDSANNFLSALERRGIPYQFLALRGLYTKSIVLDLLAFMQVVDNPYDSPSLYRILTHPMFDLETEELQKINFEAYKQGRSTFEVLQKLKTEKTEKILSILAELSQEAKTKPVTEIVVMTLQKSGLLEYAQTLPAQDEHDAFRFLHQFYERVKRFEVRADHKALKNFLFEFKHERDAGEEGSLQFDIESGPDMVKIMTVHGSKGLEFRFVFVVNLIDQRFPTVRRKDPIPLPDALIKEKIPEGDIHLEEERRLFYVAITRAKEGLFLTSAEDYGGVRKRKMSRFLHELELDQDKQPPNPENIGPFIETELDASFDTAVLKDATIEYTIPKHFSFTQLAAFASCPLQYKFAHILKIPVFGKYQMSYGKTMHNTLQEFFRVWIERQNAPQQSLFEEDGKDTRKGVDQNDALTGVCPTPLVSSDDLLKIYNTEWIDDWYPNDQVREEYKQNGLDTLKGYWKQLEAEQPYPTQLESGFTLKIDDLILKGRIDRIDRIEGGIEIVDYKTGKAKEKLDRDDKKQLLIYQIASVECLGLVPKKLTYHYLENNTTLSFLGEPKELEDLKTELLGALEKIKASNFNATPGFNCQFCDFADICEFRKL